MELLRNAGIRIWMLTGDKLETAICIAQSSRLVPRTQNIHVFGTTTSRTDTHQELNAFRRKTDSALIIRGESLELCLQVTCSTVKTFLASSIQHARWDHFLTCFIQNLFSKSSF